MNGSSAVLPRLLKCLTKAAGWLNKALLALWPEIKEEGSAVVWLALRPNTAPQTANHTARYGEAHPFAWKFVGRMQPLEGKKEFIRVGLIETGSIIADQIRSLFAVMQAKLDASFRLMTGEFPGIVQKDFQKHSDPVLIVAPA